MMPKTKTKTTATVTTEYEVELKPDQKDPAFYVWGYGGHELVATVRYGDREIRVYCDGEMRVHVWESKEAQERGDSPDIVRYCDDLAGVGITTDRDLDMLLGEERLEWVNNAWFDLYDDNGVWLNCATTCLDDALKQARELLTTTKRKGK